MAEKTILVCDACGRPAAETVTMKTSTGNFVKDLCSMHVNELVAGAADRDPDAARCLPSRGRETHGEGPPRDAPKKRRGRPRRSPPPKRRSSQPAPPGRYTPVPARAARATPSSTAPFARRTTNGSINAGRSARSWITVQCSGSPASRGR